MPKDTRSPVDGVLARWFELSEKERVSIFEKLPRWEADAVFHDLTSRNQLELLLALPERERRIWVRLLAPDDTADLVQLHRKATVPLC